MKFSILFLFSSCFNSILGEFCGTDQIPYGVELHFSGIIRLLCSKPNCYEKNYSECPERPESINGCSNRNQWVGGIEKTIDDQLMVMCCEYEHLEKYSRVRYEQVRIQRGEYFEGDEKENEDGDVTSFDFIKDIAMYHDENGQPYYNLTVHSFNCAAIPDTKPVWYQHRQWPYFKANYDDDQ